MNIRELTLSLLDEYELEGKYVNLSLSSHKADRLTREERGFLTALLYTTVEHKLTYDYYVCAIAGRSIDSLDVHTLNILRIGLCQLVDMRSIPSHAAVNETVKLGRSKGERGFVNGILRAAVRRLSEGELPLPPREKNPARYLSVKHSYPLWLTKHFINLLGVEDAERILESFNSQSYTDLTVNTARVSRDEVAERLSAAGLEVIRSEYSPFGLRICGSVVPTLLPGFADGDFFVQDAACTVAAAALDAREGELVVDVCACPGGKSFAAAMAVGREGSVTSFDLHESKLSLIKSGAERLGLENITVGVRDASVPPPADMCGRYDKVICDVPCSGLGILGKKPDIRYRDKESLSELPELQYSILRASAEYVKVGGVLVYSTCTLNLAENEDVISRFLSENGDFLPTDFSAGCLSSHRGMLTTLPYKHGTDGFFICKLTRIGK